MSFFDALIKMLVILFAVAMGYLANRKGFLDADMEKRLSALVLNVTLPLMIVGTVIGSDELPEASVIFSTLKVAVLFYGLEFLFAFVAPKLLGGTPAEKGVWRYVLVFPNLAFIGYPVVVSLFGPEALFFAVILVLPFNLMSYTLGPLMLAGVGRFRWKQLLSPCTVAAVIALVLALSRVRLPAILGELLNFVGDITVPLSLLVVGSLLAGQSLRKVVASPRQWGLAILRLIVLPVLLWLLLRNWDIAPLILCVTVVEMAMPAAVNGTMLCMEYGGDTECMASSIVFTTLLSLVTIPLLASILF